MQAITTLLLVVAISATNSIPDKIGVKEFAADRSVPVYEENSSFLGSLDDFEPLLSEPLFEGGSDSGLVSRRRDAPNILLNSDAKVNLLQLHNLYRSNVTPPTGNMAYMEWDEELAELAQEWASSCVFEHGMPDNDYPETIGQNLYIGTDPTGYLGLWMWYDEYRHYDVRKQFCLPNEQCGHYVQMAWAPSDRLGCGMSKCGMRYYLVCHYRNQSLRGIQMYHIGKPCSQCSSNYGAMCLKNLCLTWEQCRRNPFDCQFAKCDLECHNCGRLDTRKCQCQCADGWDSPDCSKKCQDKHPRCGKNPGWPSKAACSLNRHAVAETYCRSMCEMCSDLGESSNDTCCKGKLCEEGYVLDTSTCKCYLLCPGAICDHDYEVEAPLQSSFALPAHRSWRSTRLVMVFVTLLFIKQNSVDYFNHLHAKSRLF